MQKKSILAYVMFVVLVAIFMNVFGSTNQVEASENIAKEKVVVSVTVTEGDTLWGIASDYYTDEYEDLNDFIDAIKKCNGISDELKIGQKVLVPYYRVVAN